MEKTVCPFRKNILDGPGEVNDNEYDEDDSDGNDKNN
jgi:hypothetical protein